MSVGRTALFWRALQPQIKVINNDVPLNCCHGAANLQLLGVPLCPLAIRGYSHQLNSEFLVEKKGLKARVFDGTKLASTINKEIAKEVQDMVAQGKRYSLVI